MDDLSFWSYELPKEAIAQSPLADRSASRLLHIDRSTGEIAHRMFTDVPGLLHEGDLLVVNETRVTALRLFGARSTGGKVELLLLKRLGDDRYEALSKPAKRLRVGTSLTFEHGLTATIEDELGEGRKVVQFAADDVEERIGAAGFAPLPPYIRQPLRERERYQTVYAQAGGSAAAPTAGLHFTPELLHALKDKGVGMAKVNLHVGLDTFRPVAVENLDEHRMHGEICSISPETVEKVAACHGRVIAVGTTTVRTLETFADGPRRLASGERVSTLFIRPGYRFQIVDGMFTNFHMPRTTMLLMIAAFAGSEPISKGYEAALQNGYRFLSFGDSMLLL